MCWTTYKEELAKARIADKDIKVFKVCRKTADENISVSYYRTYSYEVGKTYRVDMEKPEVDDDTQYFIYKGIHSYNPDNISIRVTHRYNPYNIQSNLAIDLVFIEVISENGKRLDHFVITKESLVRLECTIPEGATYYENEFGEIVSDTITVNSIEAIELYVLDSI